MTTELPGALAAAPRRAPHVPGREPLRRTVRLWGPWLVGAAIVAALLLRADPRATAAALGRADLLRLVPLTAAFLGVWLAIDAFVLTRLFSALGGPLRWADMLRWRAATYPFFALSFHLASAALVAKLHARTALPWTRLAGGMLAHYLGDLAALASLALAASLALDTQSAPFVRPLLALLCAAVVGFALASRAGRGWLRGRPVVDALAALSLADLAGLVAGRWVWYASVTAFVWLTLPCFELHVPAAELAARMPLVLALAALPISPGGLGTAQAAMLALFAPFAPQPELLAYALAYGAVLFLRVPLGLGFWWSERRTERGTERAG